MAAQPQMDWNPKLYNSKHSFVYQYGEDLISLLQPGSEESILDVGCGSGQLTEQISRLAKEVTGIDASPKMIEDAKNKYPQINFLVADAANFSLAQEFDAIFSNATLHWVQDYKAAISCMYRHLKLGGRLVAEFGGKGNVQTIVQALRTSLQQCGYKQQAALQLWYFPSVGEYATELEAAGFRVALAQHFDRPTELADEERGITDWLSMFAQTFFEGIAEDEAEKIKHEVQNKVAGNCLKNGKWYADYKRLRIVAYKENTLEE